MFRARNHLTVCLMLVLAALPLVASGCTPKAAAAPLTAPDRTLTVVGRASVSGKPDVALINVGVETFASTVGQATQQNSEKMAAVMAKLEELGIADKDIQTSNFNINFERQGYDLSSGQYRVSNTVQVKVRDTQKVGSTLDALIDAGANQVWGVSFTIEDQAALEDQARAKAVEDAQKRGADLAKLEGVQLGQILQMTESAMYGPVYAGGGYAKEAGAGPFSPGEVEVSFQVQVTFAIR